MSGLFIITQDPPNVTLSDGAVVSAVGEDFHVTAPDHPGTAIVHPDRGKLIWVKGVEFNLYEICAQSLDGEGQ